MEFHSHGVKGGVWSGLLQASEAPVRLCVLHEGEVVAEAMTAVTAEGGWQVTAELPGRVIRDGVYSLLLVEAQGGPGDPPGVTAQVLGRLDLRAGQALPVDLLAEIAQLRAEMDMIKREFRRLAAEG